MESIRQPFPAGLDHEEGHAGRLCKAISDNRRDVPLSPRWQKRGGKCERPNATREERRVIVKRWHELALPVIGTKEFAVTWADFERGWEQVKYPFGQTLQPILDGIDHSAPLPEGIVALGYSEKAHRLIRICHALQAHHGAEPFYIPARIAGELIDMHYTEAAKVLKALCLDGVLLLVKKGAGMQASRYRWAWA